MRDKLQQVKEILKSPYKVKALKAFKDYNLKRSNDFLRDLYDVILDSGDKVVASAELLLDTYDLLKVRFEAHKRDVMSYKGTVLESVFIYHSERTEADSAAEEALNNALRGEDLEDTEFDSNGVIQNVLKDRIQSLRRERNSILEKRSLNQTDLDNIEDLENKISNTKNILKEYLTSLEG